MMGMFCLSLSMMISAENGKTRASVSINTPKVPITPMQSASLRPVEAVVSPEAADVLLNRLENIGMQILNSPPSSRMLSGDHEGSVSRHYVIPPTSLEELRKRYGTRQSLWGEWTNEETRQFYKQQLPRALQIEGALGLSLEERARLASEARHALRVYSRERCHLPGRIAARLYDGLRHWQIFGYWSSDGMTWEEVKRKYGREARLALGVNATEDEVAMYIYRRIVDKACTTNSLFDNIAAQGSLGPDEILALAHGIFGVEKMTAIAKSLGKERHELGCCDLAVDCALNFKPDEDEGMSSGGSTKGERAREASSVSTATAASTPSENTSPQPQQTASKSALNAFTLPVKTPLHETPKIIVSLAKSLSIRPKMPQVSLPSLPQLPQLPQMPSLSIPVKWGDMPKYSGGKDVNELLGERVKSIIDTILQSS
jgi:hypothetical protein